MPNTVPNGPYRVDVLPYADASWAPGAPGAPFRWAWRILDAAGRLQLSGSSNLAEPDLRASIEAAMNRLKKHRTGTPTKINPTLRRKGNRRATTLSTEEV